MYDAWFLLTSKSIASGHIEVLVRKTPTGATKNYKFLPSKAPIACKLLTYNHLCGSPKDVEFFFEGRRLTARMYGSQALADAIIKLSEIQTRFTEEVYQNLYNTAGDLKKFKEALKNTIHTSIMKIHKYVLPFLVCALTVLIVLSIFTTITYNIPGAKTVMDIINVIFVFFVIAWARLYLVKIVNLVGFK